MSENSLDPRLNAVRPDLANAMLRGTVEAARYADGQNAQLVRTAPLRRAPAPDAALLTEGIAGEMVQVFEVANGWAWVQLHRDNYVGYAPSASLTQSIAFTSHYVNAPTALVFPGPDLKLPPVGRLYLGTELCLGAPHGDYVELADGGFVHARSVSPLGTFVEDFVSVAERYAGVPYLWGGKTAAGLDCSGLTQVAFQAAGLSCPRDSDMQMASVGTSLGSSPDLDSLRRGDLVFWEDHMGLMTDAKTLLHANAYHMEVASEPLHQAIERIDSDTGPVLDIRRHVAEAPLIGMIVDNG